MKKWMMLLLCAAMLLSLAACGGGSDGETDPVTTEATSEATTEATTENTQLQVPPETQAQNQQKALAESCIDKSVQELYGLIGEPESSDYASSCLGAGDDGMLYYDGFIVYTYREGDKETVTYVE